MCRVGMKKRTITFQILCVDQFDKVRDTDVATQASAPSDTPAWVVQDRECVVILSGRMTDGKSVAVAVSGYRPSLKLLASDHGAHSSLNSCENVDIDQSMLHNFKGFSEKRQTFHTYKFSSNMGFMVARKRLREGGHMAYDGALPAGMQMLSELDMTPCQWVDVTGTFAPSAGCNPDICMGCSFADVCPAAGPTSSIAPFRVMAFDIECHSSHGEFPRATKGYERLARELASHPVLLLDDTSAVGTEIENAFLDQLDGNSPVSHVFATTRPRPDAIRSAAERIASEFGAGPARQQRCVSETLGEVVAPQQKGKNNGKARDARVLKAIRSSDPPLPDVLGDPIIQIGTAVRTLGAGEGSDDCTIMVLGTCSEVDGACVRTFTSERRMLMAFFEHLREKSPDLVTGYNVFGFDFAFIAERAEALGIDVDATGRGACLFTSATFPDTILGGTGWRLDIKSAIVTRKGSADREDTFFELHGRVTFDLMAVVQKGHSLTSYRLDAVARHFTGEHKDDVTPAQIFASHVGTSEDRANVAKYCVQDCRLVLHLLDKLNTIPNALGMAGVCGVPVAWIFLRGQGCKILSLVARQCARDGFAVPALSRSDVMVSYEGATVLEPCVGAYIDEPVTVLDFASLYPSSMISHNISHDTFAGQAFGGGTTQTPDRIDTGEPLRFDMTVSAVDAQSRDPLPGKPLLDGTVTAAFVPASKREGVLPRILKGLLAQRKRVRALIKTETDAFRRSTLDGLQLAYKVTANSLYGQLGAPTSPVFMPELAAATTCVGRQMLEKLRDFAESHAGARVIYGDTDSCFMIFEDACAPHMSVHERIAASVTAGQACSAAFQSRIPAPNCAEYEKVLCPFVLLSKKRYVGNLYETAESDPRRATMGIVLRRRDNADIVKRVYGGVIDRVMEGDVPMASAYARDELVSLVRGKVNIAELTITKTLRAPSAYGRPL